MVLTRLLRDMPGGVRVLPILGPTLTRYEYGCLKARLDEKSLILVLAPEFLFESAYALRYLTTH
jgi:hypothetical protein